MFTFVITMIILVCVLLVLVILAQNSKGGGLSSQFGGSSTSNLIGVKKTGDLLERITWGLAISLVVLSLTTSFMIDKNQNTGFTSPNIEKAQNQQNFPGLDLQDNSGNNSQQPVNTDDQEENVEDLLDQGDQQPEPEED